MDYELRIKTEGNYLSTNTLWGVISDINRKFEKSICLALKKEFPKASTSTIRQHVMHKVNFTIKDFRRGSWEIVLIGGIGAILGKAAYDLSMDYIKTSPGWQNFKNRIRRPSHDVAETLKGELEKHKKAGPLNVEMCRVIIEQQSNGYSRIIYEVHLKRKVDKELLLDTESQVNALIEEFEKTHKISHDDNK